MFLGKHRKLKYVCVVQITVLRHKGQLYCIDAMCYHGHISHTNPSFSVLVARLRLALIPTYAGVFTPK